MQIISYTSLYMIFLKKSSVFLIFIKFSRTSPIFVTATLQGIKIRLPIAAKYAILKKMYFVLLQDMQADVPPSRQVALRGAAFVYHRILRGSAHES